MIDRQGGILIFQCDACGETFDADASDFALTWRRAKDEGWTAWKLSSKDWHHACGNPACRDAVKQLARA